MVGILIYCILIDGLLLWELAFKKASSTNKFQQAFSGKNKFHKAVSRNKIISKGFQVGKINSTPPPRSLMVDLYVKTGHPYNKWVVTFSCHVKQSVCFVSKNAEIKLAVSVDKQRTIRMSWWVSQSEIYYSINTKSVETRCVELLGLGWTFLKLAKILLIFTVHTQSISDQRLQRYSRLNQSTHLVFIL